LAEIGKKLGKQALEEVTLIVQPDTILAWHRKLVNQKFDGSAQRKSVRRLVRPENPNQLQCFTFMPAMIMLERLFTSRHKVSDHATRHLDPSRRFRENLRRDPAECTTGWAQQAVEKAV
jgi:hypothetical protein